VSIQYFFDDSDCLLDVQRRPNIDKTMFKQWLKMNLEYAEARELTYVDIPTKWLWDKETKEWKIRQKGDTIGRIYYAHPTAGERFYLRMLLNVVKGTTSYKDIRTVDGVVFDNFKSACIARGLLEDDNKWNQALTEASLWASASSLREIFATMLLFCEVSKPDILWDSHWEILSEDFFTAFTKRWTV